MIPARARQPVLMLLVCLLASGCAVAGQGKPTRSSPTAPAVAGRTQIFAVIGTQPQAGVLRAGPGELRCSAKGRSFEVSGAVGKYSVSFRVDGLRPSQHLSFPPLRGTFSDSVTMVATAPGQPPETFYAGPDAQVIEGLGNLSVNRAGLGGKLQLNLPEAVGVSGAPSYASVEGSWNCSP